MNTPNGAHAQAPSPEALELAAAAAAGAPDPNLVAQLANAFFQGGIQKEGPQQEMLQIASRQEPGVPIVEFVQQPPSLTRTFRGVTANPPLPYGREAHQGQIPRAAPVSNPAKIPSLAKGGVPVTSGYQPEAGQPEWLSRVTFQQPDFSAVVHTLGTATSFISQDHLASIDQPETAVSALQAPPHPAASFAFLDVERHAPPRAASESVVPTVPARPQVNPEFIELRPEILATPNFGVRPFDPYSIRRDFPILQQYVHGRPLIWLDNAATTQKPQAVIDRLSAFYENENSNIHRAAHALAARATDAYEAAREKVRRFLGAGSVREIVFVRGATEGINLVAQSWGRRHIKRDDEVVVTWLEHHANIVPWQQLCAETGAKLRVAPVDDSGQIILEEYEKLLNHRTRLVALTQVSNALGTVTPAETMVAMAHRHGAKVLVDGAQAVSHLRTNVQTLDCDFYVLSGHKVFGPNGIGVVYGKADVLDVTPPWQGGGNMIADVTFEKTIYQGAPEKFEAGTGNIADAVGLGAAVDYLDSIGMENITRHEHDLLEYATHGLQAVRGLRIIGTAKEKAGVLSFVIDGCTTQEVGAALDREGIAVRSGHHCAQPILRRFGLESTVRPSLALYNTREDIDALIATVRQIQSRRAF